MPPTDQQSSVITHNVVREYPVTPHGEEYAIERLVQGLELHRGVDDQIELFLDVVEQSTNADLAFWFVQSDQSAPRVRNTHGVPSSWCRRLADMILTSDSTQSLEESLATLDCPAVGDSAIRSVAMVRVHRSKPTWIVAVSFTMTRPLRELDLRRIRLARRIFRTFRRQELLFEELRTTLFHLILGLTSALEHKDPNVIGHSERVARISVRLAEQLELSERSVGDVYLTGLLHDVGKIGIRDEVGAKAGPLSDAEFDHIKQHPVIGSRILDGITHLRHLAAGVRHHHEQFDGNGYPDRLAGNEIPIAARIVAVADACDAMMSPRPQRGALPVVEIEEILRRGAGVQWDPAVIDCFLESKRELFGICEKGIGDSLMSALNRQVKPGNSVALEQRP